MPGRLFYIGGEWLTYEQAHRLGYTLSPPKILSLYTVENTLTKIRQDVITNQYYDSENLQWVDDFYTLNLYKYINTIKCYKGESVDDYRGYSNHSNDSSITHILYNLRIYDLQYLYTNNGITTYKCENIITDSSEDPIVWHDTKTTNTACYFDDRDGRHYWTDYIGDEVTYYNASTNSIKRVYEETDNNQFFIDGGFVSREEFYSSDYNGIARDTAYFFKDGTLYTAYYDSYSDEYCIPNVTNFWASEYYFISNDYIHLEGLAEFWKCVTPLHIPWKYLPSSAILSFTNTHHSDLAIDLPQEIEDLIGTEITLPEVLGVYTDRSNIKWAPTKWDIGDFNSSYTLNRDTIADLQCDKVKATLSYVNSYYSSLDIPLPSPVTVDNGDIVTLSTLEGEYEDSEHIKWYPIGWDVGAFGSQIQVNENTIAHVLCEKMRVRLSFTNTTHPELDIPLPSPKERHYGDTVILPRMRGVYRDDNNNPWIPLSWDLGRFDLLYTIKDIEVVTNLIWQPLSESPEIALCGSMPSNSGSSAATSDYIVLVATGSMKQDLPQWPKTYLTDNYEIYGGQIEIWNSQYVPYIAPDFGKNSYTTSEQMVCGTIRIKGINDNSYTDMSMACGVIKSNYMKYADLPFADNYEIYSGQIEIWDSSYEPYHVEFPIKSGESADQMYGGTIRVRGEYANVGHVIDQPTLMGAVKLDQMRYADLPFADNYAVYSGDLKIWNSSYTPYHVDFPDKPLEEPAYQMLCGTIRLFGNKANRGIKFDSNVVQGVDYSYSLDVNDDYPRHSTRHSYTK